MSSKKSYYCYMMASQKNGTLYTGITSNLIRRVYEHKAGVYEGFSHKYNVNHLVWYEIHTEIESAILREKQIKKWNRQWKINLIQKENPEWLDLYHYINGQINVLSDEMDSRIRGNDTLI